MAPYPLPSASSVGVGRHRAIGGARGLGNLVRPESHPEPRGFPVQWADPGVKSFGDPSDRPVRPSPRARVATGRSGRSHRSAGRLFPCKACHSERVRMYSTNSAQPRVIIYEWAIAQSGSWRSPHVVITPPLTTQCPTTHYCPIPLNSSLPPAATHQVRLCHEAERLPRRSVLSTPRPPPVRHRPPPRRCAHGPS